MPSWKKIILSGSEASLNSLNVTGPITGSDVQINGWGSVSASLASIESGATTQTLQDVTDNGNTTTNALNVTRTGATDAISTFKNINGLSQLQIISSGSSGTFPGVASIRFESYADPAQDKFASLIYDGKVNKDFLYLINAGGANVGISGSNVDSRLVVGGASGSLYIGLDNTDPVITRDGSADALFFGTASYANVSATASFATQALSASYALTSSYVATASYTPTLEQVTYAGNTTASPIIITGSNGPNDSLQINSDGFIISGSLVGGSLNRKTHEVTYGAVNFTANSTTTIAQLPAPKVAGFTFDYIAYVSGNVLQAGRAGVVKGILRNTETGGPGITKGFQINETTTLDLEDQGLGTAGLQFTIIQDTNGTSNQLVAIANNNWPYFVNYTLTIYYNPNFS